MEETCTICIFNAFDIYIRSKYVCTLILDLSKVTDGKVVLIFKRKNLLKMENNTMLINKLCISSLFIFSLIKIRKTQTMYHKKGIRASPLRRVNSTHSTEAGQRAKGRTITEVLHPVNYQT